MDTFCNKTFPVHQVEFNTTTHYALFKSTLPTGVTNDFLISSARHPIYAAAISRLPAFYEITRLWARLLPYGAIMVTSGPFFLTLMVKNYLLKQRSLPSPTVGIINATELTLYITDLESCTWHRNDAQVLMWLGDRPWTWFGLGLIGLFVGLYLLNVVLLFVWNCKIIIRRKASSVACTMKLAKLT